MQNEDLRPHIIEVNEGVIKLGKEVFERDHITPLRNPFKTERSGPFNKLFGSEPVLQKTKPKKRIPIPRDLLHPKLTHNTNNNAKIKSNLERNLNLKVELPPSDGIKKITTGENLCNKPSVVHSSVSSSTVTAITKTPHSRIIRNKPILRSKISNSKIPGADPRFRRTRSPSTKNYSLTTRSELRVSPNASERRKNKSQSESKFLLTSHSNEITTTRMHIGDNKGDSVQSTRNLSEKSDHTDTKLADKSDEPSSKISHDDKDKSVEDATITESTTLLEGTLYQSAISGPLLIKEKPFWDDPRLIDKYGKILKPVSLGPRNSLSSWTLPAEKPDNLHYRDYIFSDQRCMLSKSDSRRHLLRRNGSRCISTMDNDTFFTDHTRPISPYDINKDKLYRLIYTNYLLAVFFAVGSICGLLLVALLVWVLANDLAWSYFQKNTTPKFTGMASWLVYIFGGIIYGIMYICRMVGYMFIVPRNEIYDSGRVESTEPWYSTLISWT